MLEYVFVTNRVRQEKAFGTGTWSRDRSGLDASGKCAHSATSFSERHGRTPGAHRTGRDADRNEGYLNQALTGLILHEVGHTLGLNHNMKASQMLSPAEINNRSITSTKGVMGSIMDYEIVNLAPKGKQQGDTSRAALDRTMCGRSSSAIPPHSRCGGGVTAYESLLARSTEPDLTFGNDADITNANSGIDPRVNVNDMTNDAIGYMTERFTVIGDLMQDLQKRYTNDGESYHEMRNAYLVLTGQLNTASTVIARYIGGVYVDRAVAGQPGATKPFTPVSRADQKRAMASLTKNVFAPNAYAAPSGLYNYLQMQRRGFGFFGQPEDPKIHERVLTIQRGVINHLLSPRVQTRITDSRTYGNEYALTEMMSDLTSAVFDVDARTNVNVRQNLQLDYVNRLADDQCTDKRAV